MQLLCQQVDRKYYYVAVKKLHIWNELDKEMRMAAWQFETKPAIIPVWRQLAIHRDYMLKTTPFNPCDIMKYHKFA